MSSCNGPAICMAGAAALAAPPVACETEVGVPSVVPGCCPGICGSGSRMSAPSPRPSAFLDIVDYLLGKLRIPLSSLAMDVVENNRFTKTWCLREPYIPRNHALKHLIPKETAKIGRHLLRQGRSLVIHGQQYSFDFQLRVQRPANTHQRIEQLG